MAYEPATVTVVLHHNAAACVDPERAAEPCTLTVRLLPPPQTRYKLAFFVRHGQSKWNAGCEDFGAHGADLLGWDHALSAEGKEQATALSDQLKAALDSGEIAVRGAADDAAPPVSEAALLAASQRMGFQTQNC